MTSLRLPRGRRLSAVEIRALLMLMSLAVLSCQRDAPAPADPPAPSLAAAGTAALPLGCPGLAEHWREVWAAETPPGLESRRAFAVTRVVAMWGEACGSVAKEPSHDLQPALEELRAARTFTGIEDMARAGGTTTKRLLAASAQDAVLRTRSAYVIAPTGVAECEEALVNAAFCGDDVDKAATKAAAKGKDDGACTALSVLVAKKCPP
jgi:hypothetical protein